MVRSDDTEPDGAIDAVSFALQHRTVRFGVSRRSGHTRMANKFDDAIVITQNTRSIRLISGIKLVFIDNASMRDPGTIKNLYADVLRQSMEPDLVFVLLG